MKHLFTALKYLLFVATVGILLTVYRSVPLIGEDTLQGLTKFNLTAIVLGAVCMGVFVLTMRRWKASKEPLSILDKGINGLLIATALIVLELGLFGQFGGVSYDKSHGTVLASMSNCYVQETSFINRLRGIDAELVATEPSGEEIVFALDESLREQLGDEKQDLTIEYYEMTNRLVAIH